MIDWERPLRLVGTEKHAVYKQRAGGTDVWLEIDGELRKYTKDGTHVRYSFEPSHPRVENWPADELQRFAAKRLREARANRRREQEMAAMEHLEGFGSFA